MMTKTVTKDTEIIIEAKRVLAAAGYLCIPRERVMRIGASVHLRDRDWISYGRDSGFAESIRHSVSRALAEEMMKYQSAAEWAVVPDKRDSVFFGGLVEARIAILPVEMAEDPIVTAIRATQRTTKLET